MNESKEYIKHVGFRFIILNLISALIVWGYFQISSNASFEGFSNEFSIFIYPIFLASGMSIALKFRLKYITVIIEDDEKRKQFLREIKRNSKINLLYSNNKIDVYKIWSKYSFLPIMFSIKNQEENIMLRIPKILKQDLDKQNYNLKVVKS